MIAQPYLNKEMSSCSVKSFYDKAIYTSSHGDPIFFPDVHPHLSPCQLVQPILTKWKDMMRDSFSRKAKSTKKYPQMAQIPKMVLA